MTAVARPIYATTSTDPDADQGIARRHLIPADDAHLTLCGRRVGYLWDWSTPLLLDCQTCSRRAEAGTEYATRSDS